MSRPRRHAIGVGLAVLWLALPGARADRAGVDAARVDWAAGQLIAGGTGIADRHAPSPAVALGTSRRGAEDAARRRIAAQLGALPLATGGTIADKLAAGNALQVRLDATIAAAIAVAAEPETDGSWHVTLAVPLEAIRQALDEPRALPIGGDHAPPVIIVDGVTATPAIGWTISGTAAPMLWVKDIPAWARDAPHVTAATATAGAITIDGAPGAGSAATLYVLVIPG